MSLPWKLLIVLSLLVGKSTALADGVQPTERPKITEATATQIANNFCQRIGHPVVAPPASLLPSLTSSRLSVANGPLVWRATLYDGKNIVDIDVDSTTGVVTHYMNHQDVPDLPAVKDPISEERVIAQAREVLTSAGAMRSNELVLKGAESMHTSANSTTWLISWRRDFGGIPYRDQGAHVGVDADTGELIGFGVNFRTRAPQSANASVSKGQALSIAAKQLLDAGLQADAALHVITEVVQPNAFWQPDGSESQTLPYARVAWICQYRVDAVFYEVWVDRETAQIVGGSRASNAGFSRGRKLKAPLKPAKPTK